MQLILNGIAVMLTRFRPFSVPLTVFNPGQTKMCSKTLLSNSRYDLVHSPGDLGIRNAAAKPQHEDTSAGFTCGICFPSQLWCPETLVAFPTQNTKMEVNIPAM